MPEKGLPNEPTAGSSRKERASFLNGSSWKTHQGLFVGLTLLALAIISYGWMVIRPGLFGDDWPYLWSYHLFGADGFRQFVEWDRPFSAFIYLIAGPLFGENVWAYHLFVLLVRWCGGLVFWHILRQLWPEMKALAFWSACLLIVYPGFIQQPHSLEFILHFSVFLLFMLSLDGMLLSVKNTHWWVLFRLASILLTLNIFALEYFIGLELLRPVFLWLVFRRKGLRRWQAGKSALIVWAPYLAVLVFYALWRTFLFKFPTYQPTFLQDILTQPGKALLGLALTVISNLRAVLPGAWRQVFELGENGPIILAATGLIFVAVLFVSGKLTGRTPTEKENHEQENALLEPLAVGGLALLLAGVPYWITGLPVLLEFPWDRSTLSFMLGVSLLTAGLVEILRPFYRPIILAALVSLAVGFHLHNNSLYRAEWEKQRSFFWQLAWRAPGLEKGSILLSENVPLYYYSDNSLTPVLNWMYAPDQHSADIPYNYLEMGERLGKALPALEPGLEVVHGYRFVTFTGSSSHLIPIYFNPPGCLRVLLPGEESLPGLPRRLAQAVAFSDPTRLITAGTANPARMPAILEPEIEHGWCYTFEKADLAAQLGDWEEVIRLDREAKAAGLAPLDATEWLPFLKAYASTGDLEKSRELTETIRGMEGADAVLCNTWNDILSFDRADDARYLALREIAVSRGGCSTGGD